MADVASDVGPVGAYEDMASWVTVAQEKAGNNTYRGKVERRSSEFNA